MINLGDYQHVGEFQEFIDTIHAESVLEIGSMMGGTALEWHKRGMKVTSIDLRLPPSDPRYQNQGESRKQWPADIRWYFADSHAESTKQMVNGTYDMVFIDGDHSYAGCLLDYQMYKDMASKYIVFHDAAGIQEVKKVWDEVRVHYPHKLITHQPGGWGIGVLYVTPWHVVTACSRPENLPIIDASIRTAMGKVPYTWHVVIDAKWTPEQVKESLSSWLQVPETIERATHIPSHRMVVHYPGFTSIEGGQLLKNYALELIQDGIVYFLDDDTVMHPMLVKEVAPVIQDGTIVTFDQYVKNKPTRTGQLVQVGYIDQGQYALTRKTIGNVRIPNVYVGDGMFAAKFNKNVTYIHKALAYYNQLRIDE